MEASKYSSVSFTSEIQHAIAGATSGFYISVAMQPFALTNVAKKVVMLGIAGMLYGKANAHVESKFGPT
ncbi:hypothetical protein EON64_11295 [archaeon]|nr:MAG: hypothetical protein EON64_11295 [archaeon]